jgi:hypothetical protein
MVIGRGVLPKAGKLVVGGKPKANKSFILINIALDLALGQPLFNAFYRPGQPVFPVYKQNRVLYIENEIGDNGLQDRLKPITEGLDIAGTNFFIKSRDMGMRMDTEEGRALITAEIAQVRPDVTIIDPLAKFHLSDENSAQHMGAVMRVGDHWIEDYGTSLIYIHHTGHYNPQNPRRGGDQLRGSTAIFADADSIILVERKSAANCKEPVLELNFELRRGEPLDPIYVKRLRNGRVVYQGEDLLPFQEHEAGPPRAYGNL